MRLVLFDCDGTLVDSAMLIHEVMRRTFLAFGLAEPPISATKSVIGLTLDIAIARVDGRAHVDDQVLDMTQHYKRIYGDVRREAGFQEPLFAGIGDMMTTLAGRDNFLIGAVTGKSRRGLDLISATHGFADTFRVSRTADDCPSKPHPAMVTECCAQAGIDAHRTIVIGDSIYDMQMARNAGAIALGVSWGYASVADLADAGARHIVRTPHEIIEWLDENDV